MNPPDPLRLASAVPGIAWPAVINNAAANLIALQWQLERSEYWPRETLEAHQREQLAALLRHAAVQVPFWRPRLDAAGLPGTGLPSWEAWRRLPPLTRAEANAAGAALHAETRPKEQGKLSHAATSGSTGTPLVCRKTELSRFFWHGSMLREFLWNGWDPVSKIAFIREDLKQLAPSPDGVTLAGWGAPFSNVFPATGQRALLDIQAPTGVQAAWLLRQDPDQLLTWPANLVALARHCCDARIRPDRLRVVRTVAETVSPALRALCRDAWGAVVVDSYSAEEAGYIALQCPVSGQYHVMAEDVLVEVLDDAGDPCRPGEVGRVVVTPLHNFAMPLLRYMLGDDAEAGTPCPCGRTLPTLARIIGRTRDRFMLPDGTRRFVRNPSEAFAAVASVRRYQIAQVSRDTIEVRVEAREALTAAEHAALADAVTASVGWPIAARFIPVASLAPAAGRKFRDVICEVVAGET